MLAEHLRVATSPQSAYKLGASAVMVTPHNEPDLNESKIINHYHMISRVMPLPIVLQDHPASSGVQMPSATIIKLVENNQSIQCIKEEAVPTSKNKSFKTKTKNHFCTDWAGRSLRTI